MNKREVGEIIDDKLKNEVKIGGLGINVEWKVRQRYDGGENIGV